MDFVAKRLTFLLLSGVVLTAGCASTPDGALFGPADVFREPSGLQKGEAAVVVFREEAGGVAVVPTIWVDGRVAAAMNPGRYSQSILCAGERRIGIAERGDSVSPVVYAPATFSEGQASYFKVVSDAVGGFHLEPADAARSRAALGQISQRSHLVSRVTAACGGVDEVPEVVEINLSADAIFAFDQATVAGILPQGRQSLDALANQILGLPRPVQRLVVTGHADRLGRVAYNDALSLQRAQSVSEYLRNKGVTVAMDVVGSGSRDPISVGCAGQRPTQDLIACLQPDRRISVRAIWSENSP